MNSEIRKRPVEWTIMKIVGTEDCGPVEIKCKGLFHGFGTDLEVFSEPNEIFPLPQSVAIVEDEDGQVHMVNPSTIKFLDK